MGSANTDGFAAAWRGLPDELKGKLHLGFTGKRQLLDIAGWCLRADDSALVPLASDALKTIVRDNPLDGVIAGELLALPSTTALLPQETLDRLKVVATHYAAPGPSDPFVALRAGRDFHEIKNHIRRMVEKEPDNLYWREQASTVGVFDGDFDFVVDILKESASIGVEVVLSDALFSVERLFSGHFEMRDEQLLAELAGSPWNAGLALRIYDSLAGVADKHVPLSGPTAVLLYSWNKADELEATLASLAASDLTDASLFVLDNGSTDRTAEVLAGWKSRFRDMLGADRFTVISLPVNVGAAAARNWLLSLDAVQAHEFVCYLDDDVELPVDWLSRFGAAVASYPEAGVWGCRVVDHANRLLIQSADSHLLAGSATVVDLSRMAPNPFRLSDVHTQTLDTGVFDFMRPCASVTGCCHLFRTRTLRDVGDFAIQLSPSQYDDMEHDLRLCEAGLFPVYQGHLVVRHKKSTGVASHTSMQEQGSALGNKYKMQTMHEPAAVAAAAQAEQAVLEADLLRKLEWVDTCSACRGVRLIRPFQNVTPCRISHP